MNIEEIREYCIRKKGVTEGFPFDDVTLVFKVMNKMYAILSLDGDLCISLKCDPERCIELREKHSEIKPGWHLNKVHWNTIMLNGTLGDLFIFELIDHSYNLIVQSLPKKVKEEFAKLTDES